jgi:ABC-2 type transport system ATP-binding protein
MPDTQTAISVTNLQKSYKNVPVLEGLTFRIRKGTIFALLGSNGAGKTTVINILTTLLKADGGEAKVGGFDVVSHASDVRKHISLTGQFAAVDEVLTARENLVLIAQMRHDQNPARTAEKLLEQFDLTDAADRRTATFSGGMNRRLDIAMSLIGHPSVIFFDEPTTGLDPQSRNMMWQTIKALAAAGTTVFLTTQYLEEADQLADRIAILSQGQIVAEGTAQELKKLLPHGQIEFRFHNLKQLREATKLLNGHDLVHDNDAFSLTITTDGSSAQVAHLFNQLEAAHIEVAEFSQKQPTLDDAFLKIITENEESK